MSRRLQHVVVTNVSAPIRVGDPPMDADRVWYLLGFFLDACLPSVRAQVEHTWLVWFDDRCDAHLVNEVELLAEGSFTPVWGGVFDAHSVARAVASHTSAPWVATTLISCDDAMARDCLATVAKQHHEPGATRVEFDRGLTIDRTGGVFSAYDESSPVRALIAPRTGTSLATILDQTPRARTVVVADRPMWIDVDHESVDLDRPRGRRVSPSQVSAQFAIDLAYDQDPRARHGRASRSRDLRRAGQELMRNPRVGRLATKVLQGTRSLSWRADETVNAAVDAVRRHSSPAGLRPVAGDPEVVMSSERVAVLAEFSITPEVRPWALTFAGTLAEAGYPAVVVSARPRGGRVTAPSDLPPGVAIVSRANARHDFGSWAAALDAWPALAGKRVLLTNDSIIGPLTGTAQELSAILSRGEDGTQEVFSATRSHAGQDYLHSYFLLFQPGTLGRPAVRSFFTDLPITRDRIDRGQRYEHGLTALLRQEGIPHGSAWQPSDFGFQSTVNLALCWRELFEAGFPFLKRRLLTHPRFANLRPSIVAHVQDRYGVDLT